MKKLRVIVAGVLCLCTLVLGFGVQPKKNAKSAQTNTTYSILSSDFASSLESLTSLGISETNVDDYTPYNNLTYSRMGGKSYRPNISGEEGHKIVNTTLNVSTMASKIDLSGVQDKNDLALSMWVNFDTKLSNITKSLTVTLTDDSNSNSISWTIDGLTFQNLLNRDEIGEYDELIFGSKALALIGWCQLELPFSKSTTVGSIINGAGVVFTKLIIAQSGAEFADDQPLSFYDIHLKEDENLTDYKAFIQDYANISIKSGVKAVDNQKSYYIGETFADSLTKSQVFNACYVGRVNYLDPNNNNLLVVEANPEMGSSSIKTFSYGVGTFKIEEDSYKIKYCIKYNGKNYSVLSGTLNASNYGKGIWIEPIEEDLIIGKEYALSYDIHKAFTGDIITFLSSDESVLKIVSIDKTNKSITVKAVKVGSVTITATLQDDRLVGTDYEDTGIINDNFTVKVVKEAKKANTTKIMLWIALGIILAILVYVAVKEIIKIRKIEVK